MQGNSYFYCLSWKIKVTERFPFFCHLFTILLCTKREWEQLKEDEKLGFHSSPR